MTDLVERVAQALDMCHRRTINRPLNEIWPEMARAALDIAMKDYREQDMKAITECTEAEFQAKLDYLRMIRYRANPPPPFHPIVTERVIMGDPTPRKIDVSVLLKPSDLEQKKLDAREQPGVAVAYGRPIGRIETMLLNTESSTLKPSDLRKK